MTHVKCYKTYWLKKENRYKTEYIIRGIVLEFKVLNETVVAIVKRSDGIIAVYDLSDLEAINF